MRGPGNLIRRVPASLSILSDLIAERVAQAPQNVRAEESEPAQQDADQNRKLSNPYGGST